MNKIQKVEVELAPNMKWGSITLYEQKNQLNIPQCIPYNNLFLEKEFEAHKEVTLYSTFFANLKSKYKNIHLRLPPHFKDARSLNWLGFKVYQRYTYLLSTSQQLNSSNKEEQDFIVLNNRSLEFITEQFSLVHLQYHLEFLKTKKLKNRIIKVIEKDLIDLRNEAKVIVIMEKGVILSSLIYFEDLKNRTVFFKYRAIDQNFKLEGGNLWFSNQLINFFKNNGFEWIDLCGANIESIANYKARIGAQLVPYFEVYYNHTWLAKLKQFRRDYLIS